MASFPAPASNRAPAAFGVLGAILSLAAVLILAGTFRETLFFVILGLAIGGGVIAIAWQAEPALTLSAGLLLSVFAGSWAQMGVPSVAAPDRIVLLTGLAGVILRAPGSRERAPFRITWVYLLLAAVLLYAAGSALAVGTIFSKDALFVLLERLGIMPFLLFLCASSAFATRRQREILLMALVGLGAYLGITALSEALGLPAFPRYIDDPEYGILPNRARGPFVEPATNGLALFTCGSAAILALRSWRSPRARAVALGVALLCAAGLVFTLTRQVWAASVAAALVTMVALPAARRYILPTVAAGAVMVGLLLAVVPGLSEEVTKRRAQQATVWDRYNLNRAATNAIEAKPLFGVGWQNFTRQAGDYAELSPDFPLTAVGRINVHNVFLVYASELGLVGVTLWALALACAIGGALVRRGPPELVPWWAMLLGVVVFYVGIGTFEYPQSFSNAVIWLLAGVLVGGQRHAATCSDSGRATT